MQERAERTRKALLMAAATVFDRLGYDRTTLAGISEAAAVSRGALSFHFSSKSALADNVQILACASSRARLEALKERNVPALQTVIDMTHSAAEQLAEDPVTRASMRLAVERGTPHDPAVHCMAVWCEAFRDAVQRAAADRSLRSGLVVRTVVRLALALVRDAYDAHRHEESPREWLTQVWGMILPSLAEEGCARRLHADGDLPPAGRRDGQGGQRNDEECSRTHCR
ncbi:TetR family transcriptional regulator [Streptomyces sp. KL2]|uniref:TetR family transcriptional regulator n=1 Tax=Streptomyces sp. KL2 TaxID=3050126 RepID=UPI003979D7B7